MVKRKMKSNAANQFQNHKSQTARPPRKQILMPAKNIRSRKVPARKKKRSTPARIKFVTSRSDKFSPTICKSPEANRTRSSAENKKRPPENIPDIISTAASIRSPNSSRQAGTPDSKTKIKMPDASPTSADKLSTARNKNQTEPPHSRPKPSVRHFNSPEINCPLNITPN